jgi:hypothetical protein
MAKAAWDEMLFLETTAFMAHILPIDFPAMETGLISLVNNNIDIYTDDQ